MLTTTNEAKADLRQESHKNWKLITPTQVKHYKRNMVVAMCLDQSCRQLAYFVPVDAMPKQDIFETALAVAKKRDTGFMPVIQCNLDSFPEIIFPPRLLAGSSFLEIAVKPTGNLTLQPRGHRNHITYSIGKINSLKYSAFSTVKRYFSISEWSTTVVFNANTGDITLSLINRSTNQSASITLALDGDSISGVVVFNKVKFKFERWAFNGSYGLNIKGKIINKPQTNALQPSTECQTKYHKNMIEVVGLVVGITALGLLTDGAGFALFAAA